MRYHALACDYDGTIARQGKVHPTVVEALERLRHSGRRLVLVTGRQVESVLSAFPQASLFDRIVAENGAVLFDPESRQQTSLALPPPDAFVRALDARGVTPIVRGAVIVATLQPHEIAVRETIREQGLALQIILNRDAVMVLPSGVDKGTGLARALDDLHLSPRNAVGVGDAENDVSLLALCGCGVAVGDGIPSLLAVADWVTTGGAGDGVRELAEAILRDDLAFLEPRLTR